MRRPDPLPTWDELVELARELGIHHLGVTDAEVLTDTRAELHRRKALGLHAGMDFTYRDPDRSTDPDAAVRGARSIIVAARSYAADEPARPPGVVGRVARYSWVDHYEPLRQDLRRIVRRLRASDERAVAFADDNDVVDRAVAHRAGVGWSGKNANLLVPGAGSYVVLGCIVTTAWYPPSTPVPDGCGSCRRCLDGCPTGAIPEPGVVDANRCLAWLLQRPGTFPVEYREALGDRLYGCDDCQEVCPPTLRLSPRHRVDLDEPEAWVDVLDLLDADDDTLLQRHGRWYLHRRDPRWWRRDALIVAGNVADPDDRRARSVLDRYRAGTDTVLAEHAAWALDRLDRRAHDAARGTTGDVSVSVSESAEP